MGAQYKRGSCRLSTAKKNAARRSRTVTEPEAFAEREKFPEPQNSVDDLVNLCGWQFRNNPFALRLAHEIYLRCHRDLMLALEAGRRRALRSITFSLACMASRATAMDSRRYVRLTRTGVHRSR
jgi:hypothetical protein